MKIYTKTGDDGSTGIQTGKRIQKSSNRIRAYGAVDEINASLGIILSQDLDEDIKKNLTKIQNELFVAGADLSNPDMSNLQNRITSEMVVNLETYIDELEDNLDPITNFILPRGHPTASLVHFARTITRRAETQVVALANEEKINTNSLKYLNRLSDLLFVIARTINKRNNIQDIIWKS